MKRLLPALAVVALALPAQAGAKGVVSLSVCGTNGCHTTRDNVALEGALDAIPQADPGRSGPFFKLRMVIGEPGTKRQFGHSTSWWMPSVGVIRGDDGPLSGFTLPTAASKAVLLRLSRGLHSFPASGLPPAPGQPQDARVDEVVQAPPAGSGGHRGGSGWAWSLLALAPAGAAFWLLRRRRRGGASLA